MTTHAPAVPRAANTRAGRALRTYLELIVTKTDPTETARALLYRHGLPEDVIDGALCLHAQELAAVQREDAQARHDRSYSDNRVFELKGARAAADLIDPAKAAAVSAVSPPPDRAAGLLDAANIAESLRQFAPVTGARKSAQISENVGILRVADELRRLAAETQQQKPTDADVVEAHRLTLSLALGLGTSAPWDALLERAAELGAQQQPETEALAAALDGMHTLIATSSRDWQTYRVDAWLWAVLCGWDCEQAEHDDTCTHGALEETAAMHGWDDATVAKARRYRAAVRALTAPAPVAQQPAVHTGGNAEDCPACTATGLERLGYPWICPGPEQAAADDDEETFCGFGVTDTRGSGCILLAGHEPANRHIVTDGDTEDEETP